MQLLVVRHAIAGDRESWMETGRPDDERPLTDKGRALMKRAAAGIAAVAPRLDLIATSPLVRAAQTAEILARFYPGTDVLTVPALASGATRAALLDWLAQREAGERVAVVGHEPDLGRLVAMLLAGKSAPAMAMRKGGACLLRFDGPPAPGHGELRWFLPPSLLRRIARR